MSVNRPRIPAEVVETIESLRDPRSGHVFSNEEIVNVALKTGGALHSDTVTLQSIPFDTLLAALVNGYERELSAHERLAADYKKYLEGAGGFVTLSEDEAFAGGIMRAVNTLGIKIEGVNA